MLICILVMKHKNTQILPGLKGIDGANPHYDAPTLLPMVSLPSAARSHDIHEVLPPAQQAVVDRQIAELEAHHPELRLRVPRTSHMRKVLGHVATAVVRRVGTQPEGTSSGAGDATKLDIPDSTALVPYDTIGTSRLLGSEMAARQVGRRRLAILQQKADRRRDVAIYRSMPGTAAGGVLPDPESMASNAREYIQTQEERFGSNASVPSFTPKEQAIIINLALAEAAGQTQQITH